MSNNTQYISRGDVYYADLCDFVGSEQGGLRPVVVIQNNIGNNHSPTTIVAAITSQTSKSNLPTHMTLDTTIMPKTSVVLTEQIRTIDKCRLRDYITTLDERVMQKVNNCLSIALSIR